MRGGKALPHQGISRFMTCFQWGCQSFTATVAIYPAACPSACLRGFPRCFRKRYAINGARSVCPVANGGRYKIILDPFSASLASGSQNTRSRLTEKESFVERAPLRGDWNEDARGSESPTLQQFIFFHVLIGCKVVGRFLDGTASPSQQKILAAPFPQTHPRGREGVLTCELPF
jgi:hypothetical protein